MDLDRTGLGARLLVSVSNPGSSLQGTHSGRDHVANRCLEVGFHPRFCS